MSPPRAALPLLLLSLASYIGACPTRTVTVAEQTVTEFHTPEPVTQTVFVSGSDIVRPVTSIITIASALAEQSSAPATTVYISDGQTVPVQTIISIETIQSADPLAGSSGLSGATITERVTITQSITITESAGPDPSGTNFLPGNKAVTVTVTRATVTITITQTVTQTIIRSLDPIQSSSEVLASTTKDSSPIATDPSCSVDTEFETVYNTVFRTVLPGGGLDPSAFRRTRPSPPEATPKVRRDSGPAKYWHK